MERVKLMDSEIAGRLTNGWAVVEDKLSKTFSFERYASGALFAAGVAQVAESMDHHPCIVLDYGRVGISVNTHDVGGISPWDFELARRIDDLYRT